MSSLSVMQNMALLCNAVGETTGAAGPDIRTRYFASLNQAQRHPFRFVPRSGEFALDFDIEDPQTSALLVHFLGTPAQLHECSSVASDAQAITALIDAASAMLQRYDPSAAAVVRLLVGCLLIARHGAAYGGATMSETLGVVWLRPDPAWEPVDCAESMLHESVHQALLLDERVNGMFDEDLAASMTSERGLVTSAVWPYASQHKSRRPYDHAFHSACVGAVLVDFYESLGRPEKARTLCEPLPVTIAELRAKGEFLTAHGSEILTEVDGLVSTSPSSLRLPVRPR